MQNNVNRNMCLYLFFQIVMKHVEKVVRKQKCFHQQANKIKKQRYCAKKSKGTG